MEIKILCREGMEDLLKANPDLLDNNYLIGVHDSGNNLDYKWCNPILKDKHDHYLSLCFSDVDYKINWMTIPFNKNMAKEVIKFLDKIEVKEDNILYVHCAAGVSRSGAIGTFARKYFKLDYNEFKRMNPQIVPNTLVTKLLHKEVK